MPGNSRVYQISIEIGRTEIYADFFMSSSLRKSEDIFTKDVKKEKDYHRCRMWKMIVWKQEIPGKIYIITKKEEG